MRLALVLLFCVSAFGQTWTTVCNGTASGAGSCPISSTIPNARGFLWKLPYDSVNAEFLYYTGSAAPNHTSNASIYSSEIWGYNAGSRAFTFRTGNGAT